MSTLYTKSELAKKPVAELKELADAHGFEFEGKVTKPDYIENLLTLTEDDALVEADDEEVDDEVEADDEVDDEEDDEAEPEAAGDDELDDEDEELDDEELDEEVDIVEPKSKPKAAVVKKTTKTTTTTTAKPAAKPKTEGGENTMAAKQVATALGTEAKTLRQFFRSPISTIEPVGSGGRYEFNESDIPQIKAEFETWRSAHAARGSKRGTKGSTPAKPVEVIEEVEEIEELELDDELDDEDLELDE